MITFTVPGKAVGVNSTYKRSAQRRLCKTDEAEVWQAKLTLAVRRGMAKHERLQGPCWIWIDFYFTDMKPDVDGPVKPVMDCVAKWALDSGNDRQFWRQGSERHIDKASPRTMVTIGRMPEVVELVNGWHDAWENGQGHVAALNEETTA